MKTIVAFLVLFLSFHAYAQNPKPATLRSILLEQLRTTHNEKDWFVPISVAVEGLTAEQASWKDGSGNHSVGQLSNHLLFWNKRELLKFKGEPEEKFSGNNDETFNNFDSKKWSDTVKQLDQVMIETRHVPVAVGGGRTARCQSDRPDFWLQLLCFAHQIEPVAVR